MVNLTYKILLDFVKNKYSNNPIKESDIQEIKLVLNKNNVISLLKDMLKDNDLLNKVCKRTYTHALGFDKIVLIDLSKDLVDFDKKVQVRLHIWDVQNSSVPMVESLHEHSFDFISTVLTGKLENQQFEMSDLSRSETVVLNKLLESLDTLENEEKMFLNEQVEILEAIRLESYNSEQLDSLNMMESFDEHKIYELTGLSKIELLDVPSLEGHFVSNRVAGEKKAYKHVFDKHASLTPKRVLKINEGDYYYHPYELPHRLFYDNKILNSTILITTPVESNPQGGSLQRPTYLEENEKDYDKINLSFDDFKLKIENYIDFLLK
jgi:hypothetical protein